MFQMNLRKIVHKSLPSKAQNCAVDNYKTCIGKYFQAKAGNDYNCSIKFLAQNGLKSCPNEIYLDVIKKIKTALKQNSFAHCKDVKPCNHVEYVADKIASDPQISKRWTEIRIKFTNFIVEEIVDSYVYNFYIIFSEIGGAIGILVGLSCMSLVDFTIIITNFFSNRF